MKLYNNKKIKEISWIKRGGVAKCYYEPETQKELILLVDKLNKAHEQYDLVGHTSNIYFKDSYNIGNLISTKRLNHWTETDTDIYCECGVSMQLLSRSMVRQGIKGFEGLIDLPGTIGGAIYGNSGCFGNLVSDLLVDVDVLMSDGTRCMLRKNELHFSKRSSAFKRQLISGIILSVHLKKEKGDTEQLKAMAVKNHQERMNTQPRPQKNLGTTYSEFGKKTLQGIIISLLSKFYSRVLQLMGSDYQTRCKKKYEFEYTLVGGRSVLPYLFSRDRFIWWDSKADDAFDLYKKVVHRLYVSPTLEIEIKQ